MHDVIERKQSRRWAQAQRSQQNVSSVTHDLSASEEVLNETRSGSTVLLEPTYMKNTVGWLKRSGANI